MKIRHLLMLLLLAVIQLSATAAPILDDVGQSATTITANELANDWGSDAEAALDQPQTADLSLDIGTYNISSNPVNVKGVRHAIKPNLVNDENYSRQSLTNKSSTIQTVMTLEVVSQRIFEILAVNLNSSLNANLATYPLQQAAA